MRVQREGVLLYSPLMVEWRKASARVRELEHRLYPGQGEEYANEVERQRYVIDQLHRMRDEARAEVARLRAQVDAVTALCDGAGLYSYDDAVFPALSVRSIRAALATGDERPCFACGNVHDPNVPGDCADATGAES
jgi:hypothetical protein